MSTDTDAILFYGYCWSEETELFPDEPDGNSSCWKTILLSKRGEKDPWDSYPRIEFQFYEQQQEAVKHWCKEHEAELALWDSKKDAVREEFPGIEVGQHCTSSSSVPHIARKVFKAHRGKDVSITADMLQVDPAWDEQLDRFLAEFNIEKPHPQPGWWLVSYWGV